MLETDYLQGDETRIKVLTWTGDKSSKDASIKIAKNAHLGYMWVFRNPVTGNAYFGYRKGRGSQVLDETLADFTGVLQSDGYSAYTKFIKKRDVELVSCLAHIRRKFFEAKKNHRELAEMGLRAIGYLYGIEARCRNNDYTTDQRLRMRKLRARPAYDAFLEWVKEHHKTALSKTAIGIALNYANNHLPRLEYYLKDGRIEIDNNLIENQIRPIAIGRKNYLFAGSHKGAERAAMMYSFFGSCKAVGVNPRDWLTDVLLRVGWQKPSQMDELLPARWAAERKLKLGESSQALEV